MLYSGAKVFSAAVESFEIIPLYLESVSAGFPSPADNYIEDSLDLNRHLIRHPAATFFVRVSGDSMLGAGIHPGDLLVVDRALDPTENSVIIAVVNGEFTVKRFHRGREGVYLLAENPKYEPLLIRDEMEFEVWGVVTHVVHSLRTSP